MDISAAKEQNDKTFEEVLTSFDQMKKFQKRKPMKQINQIKKKLMIELLKQKRVERKMGLQGKFGIAFGSAGAVAGAVVGTGVLSGVGAVVGGSGGFLLGKAASHGKRVKQTKISNNIEVTLISKPGKITK